MTQYSAQVSNAPPLLDEACVKGEKSKMLGIASLVISPVVLSFTWVFLWAIYHKYSDWLLTAGVIWSLIAVVTIITSSVFAISAIAIGSKSKALIDDRSKPAWKMATIGQVTGSLTLLLIFLPALVLLVLYFIS